MTNCRLPSCSITPPYHTSAHYPEYPFSEAISEEPNLVYDGVRRLLSILPLDARGFGTREWNPLGQLIHPGMSVVIKPNWVLSRHREGKPLCAINTHLAVLRAIADYRWIALQGVGSITIADVPQYDCDFAELLKATQLKTVGRFYSQFPGPLFDVQELRNYWSAGKHFASMFQRLPGDPKGSLRINLGRTSAPCAKSTISRAFMAQFTTEPKPDRITLAKIIFPSCRGRFSVRM